MVDPNTFTEYLFPSISVTEVGVTIGGIGGGVSGPQDEPKTNKMNRSEKTV
jgi:hypothetical protein